MRPRLTSRGRIASVARKVGGVEEYCVLRLALARIEMPPKCDLIGATGAVLYPKLDTESITMEMISWKVFDIL